MTEARHRWTEVLDRVVEGEGVVITRFGRPVAVIVAPEVLARRRAGEALAQADRLRDLLDSGRRGHGVAGLSQDQADDLVDSLRADRDR